MAIKLPPHNENGLDMELLSRPGEGYFIERMKKYFPDRVDNDTASSETGKLTAADFNGRRASVERYLTGDE